MLAAFVAVIWLGVSFSMSLQKERESHFQSAMVGKSESDIISSFGTPVKIHPPGTVYPVYCEPGYECFNVAAGGEVWVYTKGDSVCYIFFDINKLVINVQIGGSS